MSVQVLWFASLADRTGTRLERVPTDGIASVEDLWQSLTKRHPALELVSTRPLPTCDGKRVSWSTRLDGVREVAFLPPVSGG
jgi:molybdopterin converting factor small subunit